MGFSFEYTTGVLAESTSGYVYCVSIISMYASNINKTKLSSWMKAIDFNRVHFFAYWFKSYFRRVRVFLFFFIIVPIYFHHFYSFYCRHLDMKYSDNIVEIESVQWRQKQSFYTEFWNLKFIFIRFSIINYSFRIFLKNFFNTLLDELEQSTSV